MKYYSTNKSVPKVSLMEAVTKGLAADNGLFMPERIEAFDGPICNFVAYGSSLLECAALQVIKKLPLGMWVDMEDVR